MNGSVNNKIKSIRKSRGINQNKMAESLGVSRQTMTAIEKMKYNPSLGLSLQISKYFNLSVEEIFSLNTNEEEKND